MDASEALAAITAKDAPVPGGSGDSSLAQLDQARMDDAGNVGLFYPDGLSIAYSVDGRSAKEYEADVLEMLADDEAQGIKTTLQIVFIRDTIGLASTSDVGASMSWIEGGMLVTVTDESGTLANVRLVAEQLKPPSSTI